MGKTAQVHALISQVREKGYMWEKKIYISAGTYNLFGTVALHEAFMLLVAVILIKFKKSISLKKMSS